RRGAGLESVAAGGGDPPHVRIVDRHRRAARGENAEYDGERREGDPRTAERTERCLGDEGHARSLPRVTIRGIEGFADKCHPRSLPLVAIKGNRESCRLASSSIAPAGRDQRQSSILPVSPGFTESIAGPCRPYGT